VEGGELEPNEHAAIGSSKLADGGVEVLAERGDRDIALSAVMVLHLRNMQILS